MLADNTEHVISYWVLHQKFHSPALGAFAVISHWVPYLLLAGYSGALADRYNPRRMIQCGMLLFMAVSIGWGLLFLHGQLYLWEAWTLLVAARHRRRVVVTAITGADPRHRRARAPAERGAIECERALPWACWSARQLGNGLLLALGPAYGILANALVYLPMLAWLQKQRYTPQRDASAPRPPPRAAGPAAMAATWRSMSGSPQIIAMTLLAAAASLLIGNAYQAQMPGFADDLGFHNAGAAYTALLAADAAGAIGAALLLESRGMLSPSPSTALALAACWCLAIAGFALSHNYLLTLPLLFAAGFFELSFSAMAMTIVQLRAPAAQRGHIIGLYITASLGLRAFSGVTVGLGGAWLGIHYSLALSAAALLACIGLIAHWRRSAKPPRLEQA
jgi:hypothetical protein